MNKWKHYLGLLGIVAVIGTCIMFMEKQTDKMYVAELIRLEGDVIRNRDDFVHVDEQITYREQEDIYDSNTMALSEARGQYRVYLKNACYKLTLRTELASRMKRDMEIYNYCINEVN
ncbi:hypothetical protein Aeh1ORF284c [Aeromonas phage Aeh1]|uniref:Uncharacterized protein n=1 Tax=Aeromonas phage Aeh1 TaxID=2880362 RepID=Q76YE2_9CAUD|nr:hypothetical protein Aeh1p303 [Aeromonas phage Aeh1]AAQ17953.1 hypothetical protein Aeh1ORF284c [Aeromonas phage Aeh1]